MTLSAEQAVQHFAAVSVNTAAMDDFGVAEDARFAMWDWVGGRYSVWSPVGLSAAIALGSDAFQGLLDGGRALDEHLRSAPLADNLPVQMALMAVWHQNFLGLDQHVVLPYDQRLAALPDYLQQLWMESLGKSVRRDGAAVDYATGASLWGSVGSSAQHSFAQWLHQGTARALVDYIGTAAGPPEVAGDGHLQSLANMIAQAEVLARGRSAADTDDPLEAHRVHPGNRPSVLLLLKRLTPRTLGMLLAAYEHSVYLQSIIWGINAFDQYGVEQGKLVARAYAKRLVAGERDKLPGIAGQILDWQGK
jgi:glucose-6-phosphate isomerase